MKTAKKVLSIVLAVMLLVGTVVVGVSAESMVFEKTGSKLVYTATADKEANAEGVIEVNPGETVKVSVYAQANYYLGTTGGEIFCWTAGFFNTITLADVTNHNYVNNYTCTPKVIASTAATQLGTGYNKGSHAGFQNLRAYSTDCTSPFDASEATLAYTFTFVVPETAAIGATGEFRMPETCSATVATTSRQKQIYAAVNNSATEYNSGTVASIYPEAIDLTGTILNFKVVSAAAPEVPCDYAALDAAIAAAATADTTNCTAASVAEFNAALTAAQAVERDLIVDDAGANQAKIDAAAARLNAAIAGLTKLGACDYADLDAAIAAYEAKVADKDLYTNWTEYEAAYNAAKAIARDMIADEAGVNQKAIDDAAAALNAVVLTYKAADYSAVNDAIEAAGTVVADQYTAASVKAVDDAVKAVVRGLDITKQAEVDAMAKAINDALDALVALGACDYAALDAAIARKDALNVADWTPSSWTESGVDAAYAAAKAVARDMLADEAGANQKSIDDAAAALNAAIDALKPVADKTALAAAIARISALNEDDYTPESWAAADIDSAIIAANRVYEDADAPQTIVDGMVTVIERAEAKLVKKADKTALAAAIEAAKDLDEADYTPESWAAADFEAVIAEAQDVYDDPNASVEDVEVAIDVLEAAAAKLVEKADKAALKAAIDTLPEVAEDAATSETWAAYEEELAKANAVYADANATQDAVDAAEANLLAAIAGVKALGACDYTALDDAIALIPEYPEEYYDVQTWAAYEAALDAAKAVERDMLADEAGENQKVIDDAAAALVNAYSALVPSFVDRSALEQALALTPEYGAEYYDSAAYAAWQDAVTAGRDTYEAMDGEADTESNREEVATAADAITSAFRKLVPQFIDYSALEEAVTNYGKAPAAPEAYEPETYDAYEEALFAAQDMLANKDENAPASDEELAAEIAAAAKALEDAYNGLKLAPVAALVVNVTPKQEYFKVGDTVEFDYLVSKTGITKLQVKFSSGTTMTYTRTHTSVKITDNGDGTETWTIATKIFADSVTAVAKAKEGKVWEQNGYQFSYQTKAAPAPAEDKEVKSVDILDADGTMVNQFTTKDTVTVRIMAGPDTLRIRLVSEGGSTSTYTRDKAYKIGNNWVWEITTRRTTAKTYKFDIYTAGKNNKLTDEGTDLVYTVVSAVPPVGPSTGNTAHIVISADVAKTRLLVGDKQTVTVVTDQKALGVRIVDAEGDVHYQTKDTANAVDNGDGTLTWTFNVGCNHAATFTFNVEALYSNQWMSNGKTITYRVVY
ncbi:MAG: FIVAR domain-containing protein [Clostridia bacterium]|nr:FIVAR domain-containing protein [Clostridia bacterium]